MKRILVVNVNWLGDAILTTPVFKAIKENIPSIYVGVMVVDRVKDVFSDNPYIDEVIIFDEKSTHKGILSKLKFINFLRGKKFDTVFFIHRSFTRACICFLAGIKTRIGYLRPKTSFILTKKVPLPSLGIHRQDYYLSIFEKAGIIIYDRMPRFFLADGLRDKFKDFINELKSKYSYIAGINPSGNWESKIWPQERFSELSERMVKELNCAIVFIGAAKEKTLIDNITRKMKTGLYDLCGMTNLKELGALLADMDIFISNDSGPAHLSASLGINTLALFGPTSPEITAPRGKSVKIIKGKVDCKIPCYNKRCKDNICMKNITVDEVFEEVKDVLLHNPITQLTN